MDPFQLGAAIVGCLDVGLRLYTALGTLVTEAGNADSTAAELRGKVEELNELLKSVQNSYDFNLSRITGPLDEYEENIWKTMKASLGRCERTLRPFEKEVDKLVDQKGSGLLWKAKFALKVQRFDPTLARFEKGIQTHLISMQINFWNLQVYTNNTVVNKLEQILSTGDEYLNEQAVIPLQSRHRRQTFPMSEAQSIEESLSGDTLGGEDEKDLQVLREVMNLGVDVVHRTQKDGKPLLKTDSGVDVGRGDDDQVEALAEAAKDGDFDSVIQSVKKGIGVNSRTSDGVTLLMYAARHDHLPAIEALLLAGADINARDQNGWNALHLAAAHPGDISIVERLVKSGLDVNKACESSGETAFQLASKAYPASKGVMRALVKCQADVNQADSKGETPLSIAVEANDFLRVSFLIQENGAVYPSGKNPHKRTKADIMKLLKSPKRRASAVS